MPEISSSSSQNPQLVDNAVDLMEEEDEEEDIWDRESVVGAVEDFAERRTIATLAQLADRLCQLTGRQIGEQQISDQLEAVAQAAQIMQDQLQDGHRRFGELDQQEDKEEEEEALESRGPTKDDRRPQKNTDGFWQLPEVLAALNDYAEKRTIKTLKQLRDHLFAVTGVKKAEQTLSDRFTGRRKENGKWVRRESKMQSPYIWIRDDVKAAMEEYLDRTGALRTGDQLRDRIHELTGVRYSTNTVYDHLHGVLGKRGEAVIKRRAENEQLAKNNALNSASGENNTRRKCSKARPYIWSRADVQAAISEYRQGESSRLPPVRILADHLFELTGVRYGVSTVGDHVSGVLGRKGERVRMRQKAKLKRENNNILPRPAPAAMISDKQRTESIDGEEESDKEEKEEDSTALDNDAFDPPASSASSSFRLAARFSSPVVDYFAGDEEQRLEGEMPGSNASVSFPSALAAESPPSRPIRRSSRVSARPPFNVAELVSPTSSPSSSDYSPLKNKKKPSSASSSSSYSPPPQTASTQIRSTKKRRIMAADSDTLEPAGLSRLNRSSEIANASPLRSLISLRGSGGVSGAVNGDWRQRADVRLLFREYRRRSLEMAAELKTELFVMTGVHISLADVLGDVLLDDQITDRLAMATMDNHEEETGDVSLESLYHIAAPSSSPVVVPVVAKLNRKKQRMNRKSESVVGAGVQELEVAISTRSRTLTAFPGRTMNKDGTARRKPGRPRRINYRSCEDESESALGRPKRRQRKALNED